MLETAYDMLVAQPFFTGMTDRQIEKLSYWSKRSMFHAGARVFHEGSHADRFWVLKSGAVNLDTMLPGRGELVLETLHAHDVLGWSWMFPPYRWHFGAVAVENTLTIQFDAPGIRQLCEDDPILGYELSRRFNAVLTDRLQATRLRLLDLVGQPAPAGSGT